MSAPEPQTEPVRPLVRAPDEVMARIGAQVQPPTSRPRNVVQAGVVAVLFTLPPAVILFGVTTIVAPSVTDGASFGTAAFWALQFTMLIAVWAMGTTLVRRDPGPDAGSDPGPDAGSAPADADPPTRATARRLAGYALLNGVCAGLVLALQGLAIWQIATLAIELIIVLNLLPMVLARWLSARRGTRRQTDGPASAS